MGKVIVASLIGLALGLLVRSGCRQAEERKEIKAMNPKLKCICEVEK